MRLRGRNRYRATCQEKVACVVRRCGVTMRSGCGSIWRPVTATRTSCPFAVFGVCDVMGWWPLDGDDCGSGVAEHEAEGGRMNKNGCRELCLFL
ncbi:tRNA uridine-5-carboxymethylaminomethy [Sesbania bispinosa]|nr:tRNA uridine-5-carboxymethylaminomethy [Sesbania bispinosa]